MRPESKSAKLTSWWRRIDWPLLVVLLLLAGTSVVNLYSSAAVSGGTFHIAQGGAFVLGLALIALMSLFDTRTYARLAYVAYGAVLLLLLAVMLFGTTLNGSTRWIDLGFFMMQPSELLKLGVILITARYFQDRDKDEPLTLRELSKLALIVGGGVLFVLKQPDLGTSLTILAIFMSMVLFERMKLSSLLGLLLVGLLALPVGWTFGMKEYQKDRVISFLNIEEDQYGQSWQVRQSIIAYGAGRVWGKGFQSGTQSSKGFVPEFENDFASANWAEEHGFVGMLYLLSLYVALMLCALRISIQADDRFGAHIGVGMAAFVFWHVLVNLGMVTGMLPVVGLPLPLMSYGRSNLLTLMLGMGLLMNVSMQRRGRRPL